MTTSPGASTPPTPKAGDRIVWIDCEMTGLYLGGRRAHRGRRAGHRLGAERARRRRGHRDPPARRGARDDARRGARDAHRLRPARRARRAAHARGRRGSRSWPTYASTSRSRARPRLRQLGRHRPRLPARDMPELDAYLHYRIVDVPRVKELARRWYPRAYFNSPPKNGNHRALADIRESIAELRYYREAVFVPQPGPDSDTARSIAAKHVSTTARRPEPRRRGGRPRLTGGPVVRAFLARALLLTLYTFSRPAPVRRTRGGRVMVGVAQLVEHLVVVQVVAGSSPVTHPGQRVRSRRGRAFCRPWCPEPPLAEECPGRPPRSRHTLGGYLRTRAGSSGWHWTARHGARSPRRCTASPAVPSARSSAWPWPPGGAGRTVRASPWPSCSRSSSATRSRSSPCSGPGCRCVARWRVALAADTVSILTMELTDNAVVLAVPGAMDAGLDDRLFWLSLAFSLAVAFVVTVPVNRWLIARGRGHALVHELHHDARQSAAHARLIRAADSRAGSKPPPSTWPTPARVAARAGRILEGEVARVVADVQAAAATRSPSGGDSTTSEPGDRDEVWRELISATHLPWTPRRRPQRGSARPRARSSVDASVTSTSWRRSAGHAADAVCAPTSDALAGEYVSVLVVRSGCEVVDQDEDVQVRPRTWRRRDLAVRPPTAVRRARAAEQVHRCSCRSRGSGRSYRARSSSRCIGSPRVRVAAAASRPISTSSPLSSADAPDVASAAGAAALDLLGAALSPAGRSGRRTAGRDLLRHDVKDYIERNLADPGLTPHRIAADHAVSDRLLYSLFEDEDDSVSAFVRRRRLRSRAGRPRSCGWHLAPCARSARRWGFDDPAHFTRAFRAAYGYPPSQARDHA